MERIEEELRRIEENCGIVEEVSVPATCLHPHDIDQASCLLLHPRPLDSAILHSSSSYRHDLDTCGCGPNYATIVGYRTTEHPFPRNAQKSKNYNLNPLPPWLQESFSLRFLSLCVCLSVLAPV